MGFFSFVKSAGEKLFSKKSSQAQAADIDEAASVAETNRLAAQSIKNHIHQQHLNIEHLEVIYDGEKQQVTLKGAAATQADAEKAILTAGNIEGVADVESALTVTHPEPEAVFHDVVSGDTLSAISKKYYGNANLYMKIFEANQPMLSNPDKIYPGQKLRIPPKD